MTDISTKFDHWLDRNESAALVIREHLMPVEGSSGVLFPATYAASEDKTFKGGYNIDRFSDVNNVCLVDSVGSQANRIEPMFIKSEYAALVPQVVIIAGKTRINLLDAGHRAGDAMVRCSELKQELHDAFLAVQKGDAEPLAKMAPTSLVFGAWDSRDTQAKVPRLIASTIRAYNVRELTRSAVYIPSVDHIAEGNIPDYSSEKEKKKYSQRGWLHAIPSATHGGVIADGGVRREATLHLAALRLLAVGNDEEKTLRLRRYILGIALTAFTFPPANYLRQGCNLVLDPNKRNENAFEEVFCDGTRKKVVLSHSDAVAYARTVAKAFGIDLDRKLDKPDREVDFDKSLAKEDISEATGGSDKKTKKSKSKSTK